MTFTNVFNVLLKFVRMRTKNTIMNVKEEHDDKAEGSLSEKLKYVNNCEHLERSDMCVLLALVALATGETLIRFVMFPSFWVPSAASLPL